MITGKNTTFNAVCNDPSFYNMDNITAYTTYIYMIYVSPMSTCPAVFTICLVCEVATDHTLNVYYTPVEYASLLIKPM